MKKRILSLLLTLCICIGLFSLTAVAAEPQQVTILYTNDVHSYIDGDITYSKIAALKKSLNNVLLVDAGDHVQGTAYGSMDKGETIIKLMNETGYDAATLGNHEFDYGMAGCINVVDKASYPYLSCNFLHESNGVAGDNVLDAYRVFDIGGIKIAVIGVTSPETFSSTTPAYFQDANGNYIYAIAGTSGGNALYSAVQNAIDKASQEADVIIAVGHLGDNVFSAPWRSEDVIANTSGLDAFIDGHSHSTLPMKEIKDKDGKSVILTQTGQYLNAIGKMTITPSGITAELLSAEDVKNITPDASVKAIEDAWMTEIEEKLGAKIGVAEITLDNYDTNGNRLVRSQETNSGDFSADALYYLFDNMGIDVDVAIMNGGGIRNNALTGDITYKTCKEIHTFGNVACLQTVTGQQLLDALEWGARAVGVSEEGSFLHVSGITYQIDTSIPNTTKQDEKGIWTGGPEKYRVHSVKIFNKETNSYEPLDLEAKYNLAGYNYTLRDLGGGFAMLDGAVNVLDYVMEDYMVLANYVLGFENSTVKASNSPITAKYSAFNVDYSTVNGSNRIIMAKTPEKQTETADSTDTVDVNSDATTPYVDTNESTEDNKNYGVYIYSAIAIVAALGVATVTIILIVRKKKTK